MINTNKLTIKKPILKCRIKLKLKPLHNLENINILAIPSCIKDTDIIAMFKGLINLLREKFQQEQVEKFLNLKLKYNRLKYLYNKLKEIK